jgi:hypothetical protein
MSNHNIERSHILRAQKIPDRQSANSFLVPYGSRGNERAKQKKFENEWALFRRP